MKRNYFFKILLMAFIFIIFPKSTHAITFSLNKSADNLKPGNQFMVEVKAQVESNAELQAFELRFSYDSSVFEYQSGVGSDGISVTGGNGSITIDRSEGNYNADFTVATLGFKVNDRATAGNYSLGLTNAKSCTKNKDINCDSHGSNITIAALGSDATLKSLKIPNATLNPAFNKNTFDYSADVKDITEVTVQAAASDDSSKIQISDNYKSLQKGANLVKVVVTAENGTTKTYNITINLTLTPTEEELLKADATLSDLKIKNQTIDFTKDEKKYYLTVPYKTTKLDITATATNPNSKIEIDTTKLKVGKNTITITVTSEDSTNTETYQIIVTREKEKKKIVQTCPDVTSSKEWIIFTVATLLTFTLGIVLGYFLCKKDVLKKIFSKFKRKEKPKKEPVELETLSDTIEIDTKEVKKQLNGKEDEETKEKVVDKINKKIDETSEKPNE